MSGEIDKLEFSCNYTEANLIEVFSVANLNPKTFRGRSIRICCILKYETLCFFQNQGFWMEKGDSGCLSDGQIVYHDSSRVEPKRTHQWFMDGHEAEIFPNKKQAVEVPNNNLFSGILNSNISPWNNASSFQSIPSHFTDRIFDTEAIKTTNFDERNIEQPVGTDQFNTERKVDGNLFGTDLFGLSMSHSLEDSRSTLNYGGIRKVKVSQVKDVENVYNNAHNCTPSTGHGYSKVSDSDFSMGQIYSKGDDHNLMPMADTYDRGNYILMSMGQPDDTNISSGQIYHKADDNAISGVDQSYKGESTLISFGGYEGDDINPSGRLISSYDLLMTQQSAQCSEGLKEKETVNCISGTPNVNTPRNDNVSKKKDLSKTAKKTPPNNFPSNVRSLLSTGILDGVPVKYVSWSREKELRGVIKGLGYQCGCEACNFSKVINAFEYERHAGCKTKHPNNHIYFENGKTIYAIVQELRSTPHNNLFDVIQTITGSPINDKSFRIWKESYLAATRELQRIYGGDEGKL
ncbi:hypothetical protein ACFE04_001285 [Oxalis oulophora]